MMWCKHSSPCNPEVEWGPNLDGIAGGEFSGDLLDVLLGGEAYQEEKNVPNMSNNFRLKKVMEKTLV